MAIDPTGADLKRFLAEDDGRPVVMLNLLRFAPGGAEGYRQYARRVVPFLEEVGASLVYAGDCSTAMVSGSDEWDAVLLMHYPSREAFSRMVANPAYQEITHLRSDSLEAAVLQATTAWSASAANA
jgi:uncharacterized protein (DUF1330 family)